MARRTRLRAGRALGALLGDVYPPTAPRPRSDFSLSDAEIRAEANRLLRMGWQRDEIEQVLDTSVLERPKP